MILVVLESGGERLPKGALVTINAALQAKERHGYSKVVGLLLGNDGVEVAAQAAASYRLDEICYLKSPALEPYLALTHQQAVLAAVAELRPTMILAASSSRGKDLFPRVAQTLAAGQVSDCLEFISAAEFGVPLFKRPMYAGNILALVEVTTPVKVVTIRQAAFSAAASQGGVSAVRALSVVVEGTQAQRFMKFDTVKSERPELSDAEIVVSGGRAMKSSENFEKYIAPLADAFGGAIGASRAAVDSGYAPNDWQVGQTGKVVSPALYVAVGISGAIQHLAGMKDSKVIVAINKDPDAPIFEVADYGLVADLFEAVPQLTEEVKKAKAG